MDGLGYGLIKVGDDYYYNCNYMGYSFTVKCGAEETEEDSYSVTYYDKYTETGEGIGEQKNKTVYYQKIVNDPNSQNIMMSYFNSDIKDSVPYLTKCAESVGEEYGDVDFYADEAAVMAHYSGVDYTYNDDGNLDPQLEEQINKKIKITPDGKYMVYGVWEEQMPP